MVGIEGVMLQALGWRTCRANKANFVGAALEALLPGRGAVGGSAYRCSEGTDCGCDGNFNDNDTCNTAHGGHLWMHDKKHLKAISRRVQ